MSSPPWDHQQPEEPEPEYQQKDIEWVEPGDAGAAEFFEDAPSAGDDFDSRAWASEVRDRLAEQHGLRLSDDDPVLLFVTAQAEVLARVTQELEATQAGLVGEFRAEVDALVATMAEAEHRRTLAVLNNAVTAAADTATAIIEDTAGELRSALEAATESAERSRSSERRYNRITAMLWVVSASVLVLAAGYVGVKVAELAG